MNAAELTARQHAKTEALLASIDTMLAEVGPMTFGEFVALAVGESEAMALRDMVAQAKGLFDSEGCYFDRVTP